MRTIIVRLALLLAGVAFATANQASLTFAADEQAYLRIFAEAQVMKIAGVPEMPQLPIKIPGLSGIPGLGGAPLRILTVRLFAPIIAPDDATASLAIPPGLKLGPKLDLALYRPTTEKPEPGEFKPEEVPDFTILRYWGSSATVREGQPETINWGALTPEQEATLREQMAKAAKKSAYFYGEDWTTGYWPSGKATGNVDEKASLVGNYALTTTFAGNVELEVPKGVDFLGGIKLTSPDLSELPPLEEALTFRWEPVSGVLGYHAMIVGMKGEKTMITWSSSEVKEDIVAGLDYLEPERAAELVEAGVLMAPDRKEVIVPAGIFKDCDTVFLTMVGYGRGVEVQGKPLASLQTKTTLTAMLGGKEAQKQMGGGEEETGDGGYYY